MRTPALRIITMVLAALLALGLLTGCGDDPLGGVLEENGTEEPADEPADDPEPEDEDEDDDDDDDDDDEGSGGFGIPDTD